MSDTLTSPQVAAGTWAVDPGHSIIGFAVKHMGIATVRGRFTDFQVSMDVPGDLSQAQIRASIQAASVDTAEPDRDQHLRSADFFDVEQYPTLEFRSTSVEVQDSEHFLVRGELSMHGITQEIELEAEVQGTDVDPWGNTRVGVELRGSLSRGDYEMRFNQALGSGNLLVADKVRLELDLSAVLQAD